MRLTIASTDKLTHMDGVPVRVWEGETDQGTRCTVFVHRIAVAQGEDSTQFDKELKAELEPGRTIDLRYIL
jgi:hypothetical protein